MVAGVGTAAATAAANDKRLLQKFNMVTKTDLAATAEPFYRSWWPVGTTAAATNSG